MNIIFMGTPDFSVPSLKKLIETFNVTAVLTQPDRPKGRGNKVTISPVKEIALQNNIPVYQPLKIKNEPDVIEKLKELAPDFIIVVAFGQILPKEVLNIPKYGCINLHASLLPKYRGAAPINWAIINGEESSGNTTMLMDVGLDTGDILLKQKVKITEEMTAGELHDILMEKGAELLVETINKVVSSEIIPERQQEDESCYASMLNKEIARLDWNCTSNEINNKIKGLNPWPIAYGIYNGQNMKIFKATPLNKITKQTPGYIIEVTKDGIEVATGDGTILLEIIQFPGGKALSVSEYIKGNSIEKGSILL